MWRSKARAFLLRFPRQSPLPIQNQVLCRTSILSPTPPQQLLAISRCLPPTPAYIQNPRFFSLDPNANGVGFEEEDGKDPSSVESHASSVFGTGDVGADGNAVFGEENPSSISQDSDAWSTVFEDVAGKDSVFGEDPGSVLQRSDVHPMGFDEGIGKDDVLGEIPDPVFAESSASSEIFDDNMDKSEIDGLNQSPLSGENGDEDSMGIFISDESVEETVDEIPEVDIEKVENVLSILQSDLEEPIESRLDKMDLILSEEFMVRVLQTPLVLGERLVRFFRWASKKPEFVKTSTGIDLLVRAVCSCDELNKKDAYMLWDLIKEFGELEKELLNTEILNQLISVFWKLGKAKAGHEVFTKFDEFGCKPDGNTYYLTIQALGKRSMFDTAWSVCEKMLNSGSLPDNEKIGKLITFFCKGGRAKDAHLVYLMAKENEKYPPRSSVDFLVGGLSREDDAVHMAMDLLDDYSGESRKYAIKPFTSVVVGLCRTKDVEEAKKLLSRMIDSGPPPGNAVFNYVISALSKAGEMEDAIALTKVMESRGLRPDVYTYSVIMSGFAKGGLMDEAREIFCEAKKKHLKLSPVIYHILIRGYCKLEDFENALKCMNEMKENGVLPNADEYNKMIQSLCLKDLNWQMAEQLLEEMKERGLYLKGITRSLIAAVKELEEEQMQLEAVSVEA